MKSGKSLVELAKELERQNAAKKDYLVSTDNLRMQVQPDNTLMLDMHDFKTDGEHITMLNVNDIAHSQICTHLGIGSKYYDKMRGEYPKLLAENVNAWFHKNPQQRMLRTLDGNARAFLSNRYCRIDNYDIAEAVLPKLSAIPDLKVESCELTDKKMYIKAVNPRLQADVKVGDTVQSGVVITNSEVGLGSVTVYPLIYRLVCTNGMIAADSGISRRHVGRIREDDENMSLFRDETLKADDKAFIMKVQDIVSVATDEARFMSVVHKMQQAEDAKITSGNIPGVVELTSRHFKITEEEGKGILRHLIEDNDGLSLYGLANAVTAQSQQVKSYDRATELENTGYQVLTMSPSLWRQINAVE